MDCEFEQIVNYPDGSYTHSKCMSKADILILNDPCYGLCYRCAYKKLQAELDQAKRLLEEALPHIECRNNTQSGLITAIGKYILPPPNEGDI